jgi:hypothetical protein
MLNFGTIKNKTEKICFNLPAPDVGNIDIPKITVPTLDGIKAPDLKSGALSFLKDVEEAVEEVVDNIKDAVKVPKIGQLQFGVPDLDGLNKALKNIKVPTTICINAGGNFDVNAIFSQLSDAVTELNKIPIPLPIPEISGLSPISDVLPSLRLDSIIGSSRSTQDILNELKDRCARFTLDALDALDPTLRLEELLQKFQELCGLFKFQQLQDVINKIQQAKYDLVVQSINTITDPVDKISKLLDLGVQAANAGANDILQIVSNLITTVQFDSLVNKILQMNPRAALAALNAEIRRQTQLQNFAGIRQLLNAIQIIKSQEQQVRNVVDAIFNSPEELQRLIDQAVNLENYDAVERLLQAYDRQQDLVIQTLRELDPVTLLNRGTALLNDAIQRLDLGLYNRILDEMASKICTDGSSLLPQVSNSSEINPGAIPTFLR